MNIYKPASTQGKCFDGLLPAPPFGPRHPKDDLLAHQGTSYLPFTPAEKHVIITFMIFVIDM